MRAAGGRQVRQLLLLCALALGVIGMHHLALTPHETSTATCHDRHVAIMLPIAAPLDPPDARPAGEPSAGHDLLHLCLAVLSAAGGFLLLGWLLLAVSSAFRAAEPRTPVRRGRRLRRPAGRSLLTAVCVLRI